MSDYNIGALGRPAFNHQRQLGPAVIVLRNIHTMHMPSHCCCHPHFQAIIFVIMAEAEEAVTMV